MDEPTLRRKLRAIEALHDGATTEGERRAAAEARARLVRRLVRVSGARRLHVHACFRAAAAMGEASPPVLDDSPGAELPTVAELLAVLAAWRLELRSAREVERWASRLCDRLLLPSVDVHDPRAARVEVLLQLAAMRRQPLWPADIDEIERFLRAEPGEAAWRVWFTWLAGIDWEARRQACRQAR
ncbi:MAG: hypothetical protein D6798_12555 [Deltaproteobacteria bacterium]|nr:MAG: hypothetical protein D6798_12555 [Deltaproteobacteria bacterium]